MAGPLAGPAAAMTNPMALDEFHRQAKTRL